MDEYFVQCGKCGKYLKIRGANPGDAVNCPDCGVEVVVSTQEAQEYGTGSPSQDSYGISQAMAPQYAGFWIRLVAHVIDSVILGIACVIILFILTMAIAVVFPEIMTALEKEAGIPGNETQLSSAELKLTGIFMLAWFGVFLIYYVFLTGLFGRTLGKMAVGIVVVNNNTYDRISFGKAFGRFLAYAVSHMSFSIGFIIAGFTERKQALHDFICDTVVIYKR